MKSTSLRGLSLLIQVLFRSPFERAPHLQVAGQTHNHISLFRLHQLITLIVSCLLV